MGMKVLHEHTGEVLAGIGVRGCMHGTNLHVDVILTENNVGTSNIFRYFLSKVCLFPPIVIYIIIMLDIFDVKLRAYGS